MPAVLLLFTASGFAGLIYESIWSHYLKIFLGHAAYAQTLVLAIFMGGMAIGAWGASGLSPRWRDPLLAYALVEAVIGTLSLGFHRAFVDASGWAFDQVIPGLGSPGAVQVFKWTLAVAFILPQSILLGVTFPLMTAGVLRARGAAAGHAIAMLYFTNSLGAAVGVLASGFHLIGAVGLPGTLTAAGIVNLAVAALVMIFRLPAGSPPAPAASTEPRQPIAGLRLLLLVSALTGLSSFLYEIGWIRMLSLVLGASTHAFELMLSAFILGIAFGGLWVRRRIDAAREPSRLLAWVQIAMGAAALATLPLYGYTFEAMQFAMQVLQRNESGYVSFNFVSHAIAMAVMFPAAFCAGMTLPLITAALLRRGAGERSIGQVYAANTAGAIAGVALAVHVGLPLLGLKGLILAGAMVDLALGVVLLGRTAAGMRAAIACAVLVALIGFGVQLDANRMTSGIYRVGVLPSEKAQSIEFQADGKTATVSVVRHDKLLSLLTNGKSDGAIQMAGGEPSEDEVMMALLGALPQLLAPEAKRIANIGFGTGMTTHVLLASPTLEAVDTIEIEPAMVRAAQLFRPFNARALDDPRSRLHFEDAKTYFSSHSSRYDVIVSEPSNPWVSGVASLFSTEFYRDVRRHLRDGGLLLQWVQAYEISPVLLATIISALEANFTDYELWKPTHGDLIVVAAHGGKVPRAHARALANPALAKELSRLQIHSLDDVLVHRVAGAAVLAPYFRTYGAPPNSDFDPILDLNAPQARFLRASADEVSQLFETGLPLVELFEPQAALPDPARLSGREPPWLRRGGYLQQAKALGAYFQRGDGAALAPLSATLANEAVLARVALIECRMVLAPALARDALASVAWLVNAHLPRAERERFWQSFAQSRCRTDEATRRWLAFHAAVGAVAPPRMAEAAAALLADSAQIPPELIARVVAARLTALILMGEAAAAERELRNHRGKLGNSANTQAMFRLVIGQMDHRPRADPPTPAPAPDRRKAGPGEAPSSR